MLVIVHIIWISVHYILKLIFNKTTADKAVQVVADERFSTTSCDKCEDQHKPKVKPNHINLKERSNICSLANSVHTGK